MNSHWKLILYFVHETRSLISSVRHATTQIEKISTHLEKFNITGYEIIHIGENFKLKEFALNTKFLLPRMPNKTWRENSKTLGKIEVL